MSKALPKQLVPSPFTLEELAKAVAEAKGLARKGELDPERAKAAIREASMIRRFGQFYMSKKRS